MVRRARKRSEALDRGGRDALFGRDGEWRAYRGEHDLLAQPALDREQLRHGDVDHLAVAVRGHAQRVSRRGWERGRVSWRDERGPVGHPFRRLAEELTLERALVQRGQAVR